MGADKVAFALFVVFAVMAVAIILGLPNFAVLTKFSGHSTSALATVRFNVSETLDITLTDANISFGDGAVSTGSSFALLDTTGAPAVNGTWDAINDPFILENTGNLLANITVKAADSAAAWIGGSSPAMRYNYTNDKPNSCLQAGAVASGTWTTLPADPQYSGCCEVLSYTNTNDTLRVDMQVQVPFDALAGYRANAITFTATQVP